MNPRDELKDILKDFLDGYIDYENISLDDFVKDFNKLVDYCYAVVEQVMIPKSEILDIIDTLEELQDEETLKIIREGRDAIKAGGEGVSISELFGKLRRKLEGKKNEMYEI